MDSTDSFLEAVRRFADWASTPAKTPAEDARQALKFLSELYALGLALRSPNEVLSDLQGHRISDDEWKDRYRRFSRIPIGYYAVVCDPFDSMPEPGVSDLADDLSDIYRDLMEGLSLEQAGYRPDAVFAWRHSFETHWGPHAVSAMNALHSWLQQEAAW